MLASPWTMNLCGLLKAALGDIDEQDQFAVILKELLKNRGTELLDQVSIESLGLPRRDQRLITFAKIFQAVRSEGLSSTSSGTKKVRWTFSVMRSPSPDSSPKSQNAMNGRD